MSNNLAGKNVVIIGGTAGIGLAAAIAASDLGANVWAAGRSEGHIESAKAISNGKFEVRQADTHDAEALEAIFKEVGTIDHLVSAAVGGERTLKPFLEQTEDQFKAAYDKLWGYGKVVRTGAPYLAEDGSITLVSGSPARKINPSQSALSCVGASVENMVRCLAVEMAPIRVNVVSPGTVDTAMFDWMGDEKGGKLSAMTAGHLIKRAGSSEEVAAGMIFVMQNNFVTGTTVDVDGGRILS
ncbi:MAG: SDR family oxidoreductase [Gammaproteobacteria bacterium]|jgi:NAD(P)-dependent dehydrogenase (short-subunit alcohol dehydrogenase family)|nr:SDR family oxidoreductase [Gammaproteobacteria bacterium]MBT3859821.1 SDR family oxidoreductase [Gammaproteobacteria bacterium]MBT3988849.1 SDR family oxidoreductase [Gammaproteobacteria bacterium]MBT4254593.1 SDR family oxidoreductase [Gammaproteobacteria bacterium]MBT4580883.1 SDR family oxidoreductase [Gammaproteobacteria bacterium]